MIGSIESILQHDACMCTSKYDCTENILNIVSYALEVCHYLVDLKYKDSLSKAFSSQC